MQANEFAIELVNVWKRFDDFEAVKDVSMQIRQGEFFSMLGPSGCGKTTTLRMIAGFEHPSEGVLKLQGAEISHMPAHKRNVNMVFQNYALFPHLNIFDNVAFGLEVARVPRADIQRRVREALDMVRLPGMERRKPAQLSGGQQQRVALARALVNRPAVLLLDEPLGALDQKLRKEMQLELKRLQREVGITFIYVTHDQEEALTMSDRIAVMNQGRALQIDDPRTIYQRPRSRFVADFIGRTNFLEGHFVSSQGDHAVVEVDGIGTLRALPVSEVSTGQPVTMAIRPEQMVINTGKGADLNRVEGVVSEVVFLGDDTDTFVTLANDARVLVRTPNRDSNADDTHAVGDRVAIFWLTSASTVLTE